MKATANSTNKTGNKNNAPVALDGFTKQAAHAFGDAFTIHPRRRHMGPPEGMAERRHVMYSGRTDHKRLAEKRAKEAAALAALDRPQAAAAPQVQAPQAEPNAQAGELLARALVRALAENFGPALARALSDSPEARKLAAALDAQAAQEATRARIEASRAERAAEETPADRARVAKMQKDWKFTPETLPARAPGAAPTPAPVAPPPVAKAPAQAKAPALAPNEWPHPGKPAADIGRAPAQAKAQAPAQVARGPERRTDTATADAIGHTPPKGPKPATNAQAFAAADKAAAQARKSPGKPAPAPAPYVPPPALVASFERAAQAERAARITPAQAPAPAEDARAELDDLAALADAGDLEKLRRAAHAQAAQAGAAMDPAERRAMRKAFAELDVRLNSEEFDDPASWKTAIDWNGSGHSKKYEKIFEWCLLKGLSAADSHNVAAIKSYGLAKAKLV